MLSYTSSQSLIDQALFTRCMFNGVFMCMIIRQGRQMLRMSICVLLVLHTRATTTPERRAHCHLSEFVVVKSIVAAVAHVIYFVS